MAGDNIFTRAKEYCKKHPRTSFQDAIQKVKGKKVSGVKAKPKAKAKPAAKRPAVTVRVSGVKPKKRPAVGRVAVKHVAAPKTKTPIQKGKAIIAKIDRMERQRSAEPNKEMKRLYAVSINAEHKKLNSVMSQIKK